MTTFDQQRSFKRNCYSFIVKLVVVGVVVAVAVVAVQMVTTWAKMWSHAKSRAATTTTTATTTSQLFHQDYQRGKNWSFCNVHLPLEKKITNLKILDIFEAQKKFNENNHLKTISSYCSPFQTSSFSSNEIKKFWNNFLWF